MPFFGNFKDAFAIETNIKKRKYRILEVNQFCFVCKKICDHRENGLKLFGLYLKFNYILQLNEYPITLLNCLKLK